MLLSHFDLATNCTQWTAAYTCAHPRNKTTLRKKSSMVFLHCSHIYKKSGQRHWPTTWIIKSHNQYKAAQDWIKIANLLVKSRFYGIQACALPESVETQWVEYSKKKTNFFGFKVISVLWFHCFFSWHIFYFRGLWNSPIRLGTVHLTNISFIFLLIRRVLAFVF